MEEVKEEEKGEDRKDEEPPELISWPIKPKTPPSSSIPEKSIRFWR